MRNDIPIVVFNGDTKVEDVQKIISTEFKGDVVILGNLIETRVRYGENKRLKFNGGLFVVGNFNKVWVEVENLVVTGDCTNIFEFLVEDFTCYGKATGNLGDLYVAGDCWCKDIDYMDEIEVLGDFRCYYLMKNVNRLFVNGTCSCYASNSDIYVKHIYN